MSQATVIADWTASYPTPIELAYLDAVTLTGRQDIWDGHRWLWAIAPSGREGWVPDTLVRNGVCLRDYSAVELTCANGDHLTILDTTHGWCFCQSQAGETGWVPQCCLSAS